MGFAVKVLSQFVRRHSTLEKIRNIGIIAHIDAGKTTTTERMLYYAGKTDRIGNVDHGDTITDFLPQERSRGITIQSAAISFDWRNRGEINLIDTPGHADFSFEVIRALKVLDGCVTIFDAVAGVEAQTEKVWKMSKQIPKICFINKMDREGAGFSRTVKEIIMKLSTRIALVNIPYFSLNPQTREQKFEGVIDIINKKLIKWDINDPDSVNVVELDPIKDKYLFDQLSKARESLIETLSEFDDTLVETFLEEANGDYLKLSSSVINRTLRNLTLDNTITPILCGASFKNVGVQPLLDAVVDYLPSPIETKLPDINKKNFVMKFDHSKGLIINNNNSMCVALAFKVITDPIRGLMVFVRVYSGTLKNGFTVYNTTTKKPFKIGKLVRMNADVPEEINHLNTGEIGVLTGSSIDGNVSTGDTIISHSMKKDGLKSFKKNEELTLKINPISVPEPVFTVTVEPKSLGNKDSMEKSLKRLVIEDPSLRVTVDEETGQTLLSGMGELHLEIAGDKLVNTLGAKVELGKVTVSYKETINENTSVESYSDDKGYNFSISLEPLDGSVKDISKQSNKEMWYSLGSDNNYLIMEKNDKYDPENEWLLQLTYDSIVNSIVSSSIVAFQKGGKISNFPLHSCLVRVHSNWQVPIDVEKPSEILEITRNVIIKSLNKLVTNQYSVLQPIMSLNIDVDPNDMGVVIRDLTSDHDAIILSIDDRDSVEKAEDNLLFNKIAEMQYLPDDVTLNLMKTSTGNESSKHIKAEVPLRKMIAYNKKLRSLTQGRADFQMYFEKMERVTSDHLKEIIDDL
ncbi:similar to Saccharomyces cerevisiae YJL102W MEF2 Mitochondrial elongation factor involved in translational elongation [Maudiozyma saulgeensis]|uniref:Ribosome-releasing factor 2, mitochondrial n=1 Tax=Maudiozyma saulgeensis TaxID=1789683 RepID=A0A1X7R7Y4_9SACH|nr:similar to Saccharomyces cerevisiae YJL102W MEF2 Mitochondrial elongation factor involved in translational elongation [Kazachstania saulgeensis]